MNSQFSTVKTGAFRFSIKATIKHATGCLIMAALLMLGYGNGYSPSAIARSPNLRIENG